MFQALVFRMQEKTIANGVFSAPENLKDFPLLRNENCNLLPSLKRDGFHFGHNKIIEMWDCSQQLNKDSLNKDGVF